ncbi:MAG TPA: hypothetical protein VFO40_22240 [Chthoniobacterales bacterium]|nr:hypothetical protein [Chthoniobacterales bacterium]
MMIADKKTVELAEADEALRRSLASLTFGFCSSDLRAIGRHLSIG